MILEGGSDTYRLEIWRDFMGFPKFNSETFRNAMLGVGALALVSLPGGSVAQDVSRDADTSRVATISTAFTQTTPADTTEARAIPVASTNFTDLPTIQAATQERPYSYMRFDGETAEQFPDALPLHAMIDNPDKLIVLNFIDERNRFSDMQSQVLRQTLTALAPRSEAKELMLMDVVVRDREGKDFYMSTYSTYYDENNLGPDGAHREDAVLPYGVVWGDPLRDGSDDYTLFDFALMNGVQNDADLNANANAIAGSMYNVILNYNQKKVAALDPDRPTLAGLQ